MERHSLGEILSMFREELSRPSDEFELQQVVKVKKSALPSSTARKNDQKAKICPSCSQQNGIGLACPKCQIQYCDLCAKYELIYRDQDYFHCQICATKLIIYVL